MNDKKQEILEKSALIFMRYGIKSVTMDDIARQLVISKKTLYKYFTDKNDLVKTIIDTNLKMNLSECRVCTEIAENAIDEIIRINVMVRKQFSTIHPSLFFDLQKYHHDAWRLMESYRVTYIREQVESNINRGINEGLYRTNIDIKIAAQFYITLIDSIISGEINKNNEFNYENLFLELMRHHVRSIATTVGINYLTERIKDEENN